MNNSKLSLILFYSVSALSLLLPIAYYENLSDKIASHFDISGVANEWMNKDLMIILHYIFLIFLIASFSLTNFFISKVPDRMINLPNKEYWLNPSRRESTIQTIKNFMNWFGTITISFISIILWHTYKANFDKTHSLGNVIWIYLAVMIILTLYLLIRLYYKFNKIEKP